MDTTEPFPLYLVVDVGEPASANQKANLVNWILDGLRVAPDPLADLRMVLVLFATTTTVLPARRLRDLGRLDARELRLGEARDFGTAFDRVCEAHMTPGGAGLDGPPGSRPLVVFVTDGHDGGHWRRSFDRLRRTVDPIVVPVVYGVADHQLAAELESRPGTSPKIPRRGEPASAVVDTVLRHAAALVPGARPAGADRPGARPPRSEELTVRIPPLLPRSGNRHTAPVGVGSAPVVPQPVSSQPVAPQPVSSQPVSSQPVPSQPVPPEPTVDLPPVATAPPVDAVAPSDGREPPEWEGSFTPFVVGAAGRAGEVRPLPAPEEWDWRDTVCDGITFVDAGKRPLVDLRAASVRGSSHRYSGVVRQDDYSYRRTEDSGFLVCAVSDGVSSGALSHRAATFVTRKGCELVAGRLATEDPANLDWSHVLDELAKGVIGLGTLLLERQGSDAGTVTPGDVASRMAATVVFAVVDVRAPDAGFPVHVCAVGDSAAWVLRDGIAWDPVTPVKNEGKIIASSRTPALPMLAHEPVVPVATTLRPDDALVLMTDGIGDALVDGAGPVGRFLAASWRTPPAMLEFAAQVDFLRKTHDDDRTAVAVWPGRYR